MIHTAGILSTSIVVYTPRSHHRSASYSLIQFLNQVAGVNSFTIKEGAEQELECRFGPDVSPGLGVVLADCLWLPYSASHHDYFVNQFQSFLVDLMLDSSIVSNRKTVTMMDQPEIVVSPPVLDRAGTTPKNTIHPSLRKICAPMYLPSLSSSDSPATVRSLNSWLDWKARRSTNNGRVTGETPMQVILRLSRAMDELLTSKGVDAGQVEQSGFLELEECVCELQVTPLPKDPVQKVAFALNLHNLVVRHAMILSASMDQTWRWPQSLSEMNLFFSRIGYEVDGARVSVQDLRLALFGQHHIPLLDTKPLKERRHWFGICNGSSGIISAVADASTEVFYSQPCIQTDIRVLFAMAHGGVGGVCVDHPVWTICPEKLDQALNKAAEDYCQAHIQVQNNGRVLLPTLLSWHRRDLGHSPAKVLRSVQDWMSTTQRKAVGRSWAAGDLKICFRIGDPQKDWDCGIVLVESNTNSNKGSGATNKCKASPSRLPPLSPHKSSPRKSSVPARSPRRSPRKLSTGTSTPVQSQPPVEIEWSGFPCDNHRKNNNLQESARNPWRAVDLPPMPSLVQPSHPKTRPQASVGDWRVVSPQREKVIQPNNSSPTTVTAPGSPAAYEDYHEDDDNNNNLEPGSNVPTLLLSNISGITFGSDFDILVSGRRWAVPPPVYPTTYGVEKST